MSPDEPTSQPPWWHSMPQNPPVDSMWIEALRLADALKKWADDTGAVETASAWVANASQTVGQLAAEYGAEVESEPEPAAAEHRCRDCPICIGLDALEANRPEAAALARSVLGQASLVIAGLLGAYDREPADAGADGADEDPADPGQPES